MFFVQKTKGGEGGYKLNFLLAQINSVHHPVNVHTLYNNKVIWILHILPKMKEKREINIKLLKTSNTIYHLYIAYLTFPLKITKSFLFWLAANNYPSRNAQAPICIICYNMSDIANIYPKFLSSKYLSICLSGNVFM